MMSGFSRSLWEFAFERMMMPKYAGRAVRRPSIRRAGAARDVVVRVTQDGTRTSPVSEIAIPAPSPRRARSRLRGRLGRDASSCLGFVERARAERRARRRDGRPGRVSDPRDARGMLVSATRVSAASLPSRALLAATARARVRRVPFVHRVAKPCFCRSASRAGSRARPRATAGSFPGARVATPWPPRKDPSRRAEPRPRPRARPRRLRHRDASRERENPVADASHHPSSPPLRPTAS